MIMVITQRSIRIECVSYIYDLFGTITYDIHCT